VIYLDSVVYAEQTMTVALGVLENGAKQVLGVRQGATENAAVCTALLEDLQERGLDTSQPTLLVLDGSKALHAAASLREGMEETLTVVRLGIPDLLRRTLATT